MLTVGGSSSSLVPGGKPGGPVVDHVLLTETGAFITLENGGYLLAA